MLYTKAKLKDGTTVNTEIRPDNTFTKCSECGKELPVCLNRLFHSGCKNPLHVKFICSECTDKKLKKAVDPEALIALSDSLASLGFGKEIVSVYHDFGIIDAHDLESKEYEHFINALFAAVADAV